MSADAATVMDRLDSFTEELDRLSNGLAQVERDLEPIEREYEQRLSGHEAGLWERHINDGEKFPPEKLRERLAVRAMQPELVGRRAGLIASRKRIEKRVATLKSEIDAQRSILSALKLEAEGSGAGLRRAA